MIGLDTNVIVRHLTQDDSVQGPKATAVIERRLTVDDPGFVSVVTTAELAWVLERAYRLPDNEIARAFELLLGAETLVFEHENEVFAALTALQEGRGSFADALIAELAMKAGCKSVLTFDVGAARLPGFELI